MAKLTPKQARFVAEFLVDSNATQAAVRAGYSPRSAHVQGAHNLTVPSIRAAVDAATQKRVEKLGIKGEKVLAELALFAHSDPADCFDQTGVFLPIPKMPEHMRRAIKSFEIEELYEADSEGQRYAAGRTVKVSFWPKDRGLELLGKNQKLFVDVKEHRVDESLADLLAAARDPAGDDS